MCPPVGATLPEGWLPMTAMDDAGERPLSRVQVVRPKVVQEAGVEIVHRLAQPLLMDLLSPWFVSRFFGLLHAHRSMDENCEVAFV